MRRLMHLLAIAALIGSAVYAYSIKYDTIFLSEQVAKLKNQTARERESIAVLRAEWQFLNKPDRLQALADKHLDLAPGSVQQIVRWQEIPVRPAPVDSIARKLEALGLGEPTNTPGPAKGDARTPTTTGSIARKP
jgi:cell division protein FtsL